MDLSASLTAAVGKLVESGKIETAISIAVEKTVVDVINEELRTYSDFGKQVKEAVKGALKFDRLELPEYNAILLDALRQHIDATMREQAARSVKALAGELLRTPPASIKLSDLVETYKEHIASNRYRYDRLDDSVGLIVNRSDAGFVYVGLHHRPAKSEYECDFRLMISKSRGSAPLVAGVWIGGHELKHQSTLRGTLFIGDGYGFERTLFQLWANQTPFEVDEDACDLELPEPECECA